PIAEAADRAHRSIRAADFPKTDSTAPDACSSSEKARIETAAKSLIAPGAFVAIAATATAPRFLRVALNFDDACSPSERPCLKRDDSAMRETRITDDRCVTPPHPPRRVRSR